jgi:hypothetical protein
MEMTRLPNLARHDWWMLAIVVSIIWGIEGVMEGNTLGEILVGPVMVLLGRAQSTPSTGGSHESLIGAGQDGRANARRRARVSH